MEKTETATEENKGAMALLIDGAVLIQQKQYVSLQYIRSGVFLLIRSSKTAFPG